MSKPKSVSLSNSTREGKKMVAIFYDKDGKKIKTIHFGQKGASDYTIHKDDDRKQRYIARHQKNEDWTDPMKAGTLSRYILWNKPTIKASFEDYLKRFNLSRN